MPEIILTNGMRSQVSGCDFERISAFKWCARPQPHAHGKCYAAAFINGRAIFMHRFILGAADDQIVDHINRDRLDNRRENLRFCSYSLNSHNSVRTRPGEFRGVEFRRDHQRRKPYRASLRKDHEVYRGPHRETAIEAALDYDHLAVEHYGAAAVVNFPHTVGGQT